MAETGRGDENGKDSKDQKRGWVEKLRRLIRPVVYLGHNWISRIGVVLTTTSAITLVLAYISQLLGYVFNPYMGIIIFMILPGIFILGLLLIPLGIYREFRQRAAPWGCFPPNTPWFHFRARSFAARPSLFW